MSEEMSLIGASLFPRDFFKHLNDDLAQVPGHVTISVNSVGLSKLMSPPGAENSSNNVRRRARDWWLDPKNMLAKPLFKALELALKKAREVQVSADKKLS